MLFLIPLTDLLLKGYMHIKFLQNWKYAQVAYEGVSK